MIVGDLHDTALYAWRDAGVRDAVLVHVDAHHDADAKEWDFVTISNFVWWAVRDRIVREVFWVVPDPSWERPSDRALILRSVTALARQHDASSAIELDRDCIRATVGATPFTACSLSALPARGEVLLDVDVDYFLVPSIAHELPPCEGAMPWTWPAEFVASLRARAVSPAVVTIATSTRGGFTPLEWKYLGDELCARLSGSPAAGFDALRDGAIAEHERDPDAAEARYRRAIDLLPSSAGARYRLARLFLLRGEDAAARRTFEEALEQDSSYRAVDSAGRAWHAAGNAQRAAAGYKDVLRMDPGNPYAELGLAQLAAACDDHGEAIARFERTIARCETLVDAHRGIARSLESIGDRPRAMFHYERSIYLELRGHAPIDAPIATRPRDPRTFDATHWDIHRRLAWLQHRARLPQAVASARMALFGDPRRLDLYWLLALERLRAFRL